MPSRWDIGADVRVVRNLRNDGTYPGADTGTLLIRRGSVGTVVDIGTFLQDQVIYSVHFLEADRIVGCREEELIGGDEAWMPSAYEVRERVVARKILAVGGDTRVPRGAVGEILQVVRRDDAVTYHVHFACLPGRILAVPEAALGALGAPAEMNHA
ncbi:MAG: nitrogen fixation protein NifZ [Rhodocyclaceae bacterium]|nr:nitrogen fixation protein NifZ [Rhodocyclaceae bacterium]